MVYLHAFSLVNAMGDNIADIRKNWALGEAPGMQENNTFLVGEKRCMLGVVAADLTKPGRLSSPFESRNNRLLWHTWNRERERFNYLLQHRAPDRIAIVLGTSTSGSKEAEKFIKDSLIHQADAEYDARSQEPGNPSEFLRHQLGVTGPTYTISTACTSSTRAIISGARLIESGLVDSAIVGGVDTLSSSAINGFHSLGAMSYTRCRPFAHNRSGITIGEGAGLMWLDREPSAIALAGYGESSDAYHISSPDPDGLGAETAMREALNRASLTPKSIDYINAHGTATLLNDQAEASALNRVFGEGSVITSTKNLTGHTLGAAGITEAGLICLLLSDDKSLPICGQFFDGDCKDPKLPNINLLEETASLTVRYAMTNNFAFGGNNASLIFGRT